MGAGERLKVVAFDGSARDGSVTRLLEAALAGLDTEGLETELLRLEKDKRTGCYACGECGHKPDLRCARPADDGLRRAVRKVLAADAVLIGSPVYLVGPSPGTQALLQRAERRARARGGGLAGKVGAAVVDLHSDGAARLVAAVEGWMRANEMIVAAPMDDRRPPGSAGLEDPAAEDAERMARLASGVARLLERSQA